MLLNMCMSLLNHWIQFSMCYRHFYTYTHKLTYTQKPKSTDTATTTRILKRNIHMNVSAIVSVFFVLLVEWWMYVLVINGSRHVAKHCQWHAFTYIHLFLLLFFKMLHSYISIYMNVLFLYRYVCVCIYVGVGWMADWLPGWLVVWLVGWFCVCFNFYENQKSATRQLDIISNYSLERK